MTKPAKSKAATAPAKTGGGKRKLLLALPAVLSAAGAGLWFSGILPNLLGLTETHAAADPHAPPGTEAARTPVFFDMPEIVANLNGAGRRSAFIKLRSKLELARVEDAAAVTAAMPRLLDLFTSYLREIRPEELRGSAGTHRLREELIGRANLAIAALAQPNRPAPRIADVLFVEILIQ